MDLTVHIPGTILPVERGRLFSDPLDAALRASKLGELVDEGTQMGMVNGKLAVVGCDIHLRVSDTARALEIIRDVLRRAGAAAETTIRENGESPVIHEL